MAESEVGPSAGPSSAAPSAAPNGFGSHSHHDTILTRPSSQAVYEVGCRVLCQATFDNAKHPAEVIERRQDEAGTSTYYIHYNDCDKRLDEWVEGNRLVPLQINPTVPDCVTPLSAASLAPSSPFCTDLATGTAGDQKMTRHRKRRFDEMNHVIGDVADLPPIDQDLEKQHQEKTKVKNIQSVELGRYEVDTWYYSPYPEPYASLQRLYLCEFCLKYFCKKKTLLRHLAKGCRGICNQRHPPGDEIYRSPLAGAERGGEPSAAVMEPQVAVFEVDGRREKVYCQSLCLLSKLFLDHKTLYYDVDPFLFYILTEIDADGHHIVGYFSKEKASLDGYNLACILTLPPYQRKGYGRFLISFSYELSKKEGKIGTPERPLSDLGHVSYRSYWMRVILETLRRERATMSIKDIVERTAIAMDDIVRTLTSLNLIKYWKGDHIIDVTPRIIDEHLRSLDAQRPVAIEAERILWSPFVCHAPPSRK